MKCKNEKCYWFADKTKFNCMNPELTRHKKLIKINCVYFINSETFEFIDEPGEYWSYFEDEDLYK